MTERVTAAEIESHVVCPRRYEFEHERQISARESNRDRARERRSDALSDAVTAGLRAETDDEAERVEAALDRLDDRWDSSSSVADAQETYERNAARAAIEAYFSGMGDDHAENVVETDATLHHERDGIRFEVPVDAVVARDGTYLAIRYVPDLSGILHVGWSDDNVENYRDGSKYFPRQIASFATAGLAIRSLRSQYGLDARVDFAYVSLLENSRPSYRGDGTVAVTTEARHFRGQYGDEEHELVQLLEEKAEHVTASMTDPTRTQFDNIVENACSYCAYRDACPDFVRSQVSFADRTGSETTEREHVDAPRDGAGE